jgi:Tfp pilus assembly protein PilN
MSEGAMNLLPPARRTTLRLRRRLHVWALVAAGYGMATVGACITLAAGEPEVDHRETRELTALTREIDAFKADIARFKDEIRKENLKKQGADLVADHPDWSILLELLAEHRGDDVVLEGVDVSPVQLVKAASESGVKGGKKGGPVEVTPEFRGASDVKVEGFARVQTAVTDFADRLQRSEVFESVTLMRSSSKAMGEESVIEFSIHCRLGAAAVEKKDAKR